MMSNNEIYISVDVEASGPFAPTYSMLSIGACVVGAAEESYYAELTPISKQVIAEALKVVGKTLEHFTKSGREPKSVMAEFDEWVNSVSGGRTPVFVGFNAAFDWAFVNWYFYTYLGKTPFGMAPLDIKAYFMGLKGVDWEGTRSSRIPEMFKGPTAQTHNALDDARSQAQMFEKMLHYAQGRQCEKVRGE